MTRDDDKLSPWCSCAAVLLLKGVVECTGRTGCARARASRRRAKLVSAKPGKVVQGSGGIRSKLKCTILFDLGLLGLSLSLRAHDILNI